jgi:hypothetical protein
MKYANNSCSLSGGLAELVDAYALGAYDFGHVSSSLMSPTRVKVSKDVNKNDYAVVYDMLVLSTNKKKKGVVNNKKKNFGSLRKNHTFHLNNTCDNYYLSTRCFFNLTSTTHLWWSCRRFTKTTRRRTHGSLSYKEMFSQCPQKHISPHYNNN